MSDDQRKAIRLSLLGILASNPTSFGTPVSLLCALLPWRIATADISAELLCLKADGFVQLSPSRYPEHPSYRIAKQGQNFLRRLAAP